MGRWLLSAGILLAACAAAAADAVTEGADAAQRAAAKKDRIALRILAQGADPDPWLVAEELCARRAFDAADALAAATAREDVAKLPAYVTWRRSHEPARGEKALAAAGEALDGGQPEVALAGLESVAIVGDDVPGVVVTFARALALRSLERSADAAAAFRHAAEMAGRIGWLAMASRSLREGAAAATDGGHASIARALLEKRLHVAGLRKLVLEEAATHEQIGALHTRTGSWSDALEALTAAADRYRSSGDRPGRARTAIAIGDVHLEQNDLSHALEQHEEALELARALERPDLEAQALLGVGVVRGRLGDYPDAKRTLERALDLAEKAGDQATHADALGNLGVVTLNLGNYAQALALEEQSLAAQEKAGNGPGRATSLANLGMIHAALGDYERALACEQQALALQEALGNRAGTSAALGNIGTLHCALGDYDEGLACQQRALAVEQQLGNVGGVARALGRIGRVYAERRDFPRALELLQESILLRRRVGDRLGEAMSLEMIGYLQAQIGNYAESESRRRESLYLAEDLGALDLMARNYWGLAELHLTVARPDLAVQVVEKALAVMPTSLGRLGDEQGANARERWAGLFDVGMAAASELDDVRRFCRFLEQGRAGMLLETLGGREAILDAVVPVPLRDAEARARAAETLAVKRLADALEAGARPEVLAARATLKKARAEMKSAMEAIHREAKSAARVIDPKLRDVRGIQRLLRSTDALVLYALLPDEALALVVTTREARIVSLGHSTPLIQACESLVFDDARREVGPGLEHLASLLVAPLELPKRTRRVLVSPYGALSTVPFTLVFDGVELAYVPSATTYGFLRRSAHDTGRGVLALGFPIYGPDQSNAAPGGPVQRHPAGVLAPLEGSAEEAHAIGDIVLTGAQANEDALIAGLLARERWRALHLACHGIMDEKQPLYSALALTPNEHGDGLLSTLDVFRMNVPADLVVLSACETGRGRIYRTEGVYGFTRAFMFAGASRVMVSLWKVDDEATRALMVKFYELWNPERRSKGLPAARALREAQAYVRAQPKWSHPYYWAAWQLWGLPD